MCERYGDRGRFLQTFGVVEQQRHASAPERCVLGTAPTLREVNEAYGQGTAEEWLLYQITDLSEFVGARDKMQPWKLKVLARKFMQDFDWFRVTDVELFMHRLKLGAYGHFYGSVDPQQLMAFITPFLKERNEIIAEAVKREERERREHLFDGCVNWEDYHRMYPDRENPFEWLRKQIAPPTPPVEGGEGGGTETLLRSNLGRPAGGNLTKSVQNPTKSIIRY